MAPQIENMQENNGQKKSKTRQWLEAILT